MSDSAPPTPSVSLLFLNLQTWETNSPHFRHASHREENTGLLIGFLLIKEMWQIRFFFGGGGG